MSAAVNYDSSIDRQIREIAEDLNWHNERLQLLILAVAGLKADLVNDPGEALLLGLRELRDEVGVMKGRTEMLTELRAQMAEARA